MDSMEKYVAALVTTVAATLFSLGYLYLSAYYAGLGVNMLEVDYTIQDIFVHSIVAIFFGIWSKLFFLVVVLTVLLIVIVNKFGEIVLLFGLRIDKDKLYKLQKMFSVGAAVLVCIFCLFCFAVLSIEAGSRKANNDFENARPLWIGFDPQHLGILEPMSLDSSFLTFVSATNGYVFAAIKFRDGKDAWIVRLDRSKLGQMRVYKDE